MTNRKPLTWTVRTPEGPTEQHTTDTWRELLRTDYARSQCLAFYNTGCLIAWPSWWQNGAQTDCLHLDCLLARKEHPLSHLPWLARFNAAFRSELSNWLRFALETPAGRVCVARLYWAMKKTKRFDIMAAVWVGVQ